MNYVVLKRELLEKVKNRSLDSKELMELEDGAEVVLVKAPHKEDPKLSIKREGERYSFLVTWDDSVDSYQSFLTAYEEFTWCLKVSEQENK